VDIVKKRVCLLLIASRRTQRCRRGEFRRRATSPFRPKKEVWNVLSAIAPSVAAKAPTARARIATARIAAFIVAGGVTKEGEARLFEPKKRTLAFSRDR
jgi:hypothetical protein